VQKRGTELLRNSLITQITDEKPIYRHYKAKKVNLKTVYLSG
jgi:hypothetical protein